jgi:type II secretory pathway component HofQ
MWVKKQTTSGTIGIADTGHTTVTATRERQEEKAAKEKLVSSKLEQQRQQQQPPPKFWLQFCSRFEPGYLFDTEQLATPTGGVSPCFHLGIC